MPESIDALVQHWKSNPSSRATIALCDALRESPHAPLVQQVGEFATQRLGDDAGVLLSVARMYMEVQRYADAQQALVAAGKLAPRDSNVYRHLGEVLLRRGDADRAEKVLGRAIQLGAQDEDTRLWLEHARMYKPMQGKEGAAAVAAELARQAQSARHGLIAAPAQPMRDLLDSMSETTTGVIQRPKGALGANGHDDETAPGELLPRAVSSGDIVSVADDVESTEITDRHPLDVNAADTEVLDQTPLPTGPVPRTGTLRPPMPVDAPVIFSRADPPLPAPAAHASAVPTTLKSPRPPPPASAPAAQSVVPAKSGQAAVPHPRDVLDALELSGLYEPRAGGAAGWDKAPAGPKRKGMPALVSLMVLFVGAAVGTYYLYRDRRAKDHLAAEGILATAESQIAAGKPADLPDLEKELGRVFQLESRSPRAALDWTKDRALTSLLKGGEDVGFEDAMARAKEVGVAEDKYAFARVASFLYQSDTAGAASAMSHWDGPAGGDAWFQLIAGATLERAGDARARDRYALAAKLDAGLFPAQVALARVTAIDGDPAEARRLATAIRTQAPDRAEGIALVALAWARDPRRDEAAPPPEVEAVVARADDLPVGLRAVPNAILAMRALDKRAADEARAQVQKGLAVANSPGMAVWLGTIALPLGDEALSRKAALAALQMSAAYTPARSLAARVALLGGRLDEALKATEELDATSPDVAVVRAAAAYERVDIDALARAMEALSPEARKLPFVQAFATGPDQLLGKVHVDGAKLVGSAADEAPWRDLVSMDTALDDGDLATAGKIAAMWGKDAESQPLRALRLARLARYEGRLDAADALSQVAMERGTVTPRVLTERAFTLVARNHAADVGPLLAHYPLVLGPVGSWMGAFASASSGSADTARGRVASLDPPPSGAPLLVRVVAAAAFGAMKDRRRGADYVKDVFATGSLDPDLVAAATALGFKKVDHFKKRPTYE
jgi:hypothetical protein